MTVIDKLLALYQVDRQLRGLTSRIESSKQHLRAQQAKLDDLTAQRSASDQERMRLRAEVANLEAEIKGYDERIARLREQMNQAKTNREYTAFLTEVNTFKADRGKIEEQALGQMTRIEEVEARIAELDAAIAEREKVRHAAEQEVARREQDAAERLAELQQERAIKASAVPGDYLSEYARVAKILHDEEPMAPVVEENRKRMEYSCGHCYMAVPAETFNALLRGQRLVTCSNCGVILYIEPTLAESIRK